MTDEIDKKAREAAARAAGYLMKNGWTQGAYFDSSGRTRAACAIGAKCAALGHANVLEDGTSLVPDHEVSWRLDYLMQQQIGTMDIAGWNDAPGRTAEDVVLMFKKIGAGA